MALFKHAITGKVADLDPEYAELFDAFEPVSDETEHPVVNDTDDVPEPPAKRTARRVPSGEVSARQDGEPTA